MLGSALALNPQVAIRPEAFGALAYHYGNRRLVFLRDDDLVRVVDAVGAHDDLRTALEALGIDPARWPALERAIGQLVDAEMLTADAEATNAR